jgi:predicted Zn-dependent protease
LFRALVIGELPASSDDPAVRALIDGERLRRAGRPAEALAHFDVSLNLAPDAVLVVALRALARLEAGQFAGAADGLESVARELSASLTLHRSLGRAYEAQALTADAVMAREAARALAPGDPAVGFDLARAYHEAGRPADALAQARRVLELDALTGRELCAAYAQSLAERGQDQAAAAYAELALH